MASFILSSSTPIVVDDGTILSSIFVSPGELLRPTIRLSLLFTLLL